MENNKFWIYLCLGVVAALSLKWFSTTDATIPAKHWSLQANMEDEIQFKRSAKRSDKIAGLSNSRRTTEMNDIQSGTTSAVAAVVPAPGQKVAKLENTAKKKDAKKKKKKKKVAKVIAVPGSGDAKTSDDAKKNLAADMAPSGQQFVSGAVGNNAVQTPATLTEWERLLLATPNHRETTRFISLYQTKQISSELFYTIVGEMLSDGRTAMRELGVISLGATPSLKSYEMLVALSETEHGTIKTQAQSYLDDSYNRPQSINVIYSALTATDVASATQVQALRNLDSIVLNTRGPSSQPADPSAETPAPTKNETLTQQRVLEYFRLLQGVLGKLKVSAADEQVRSLSQTVLSHLDVALATPVITNTMASQ